MKFKKEPSGARQCSLIPNTDPLYWKRGAVSLDEGCASFRASPPSSPGFPSLSDDEEDEEEVYRLAGVRDFKQGRHLLTVSRRQRGRASPPLLEGPPWTGRPLPFNPRGQHGAVDRCMPGTNLAVAWALHASGSFPQGSLPDRSSGTPVWEPAFCSLLPSPVDTSV